MTKEERKQLEGFLSKTLKMDTEGIATLFNEAGDLVDVQPALDAYEAKQRDLKALSENQYKRGIKEQAAKLEKALREKYEIESEATGMDLIEEVFAKQMEGVKEQSQLKDEDVEKHPLFITKRAALEKQLKAQQKEYEEKMQQRENEIRYEQTLLKVKPKLISELKAMGAVLPDDPNLASEWEAMFIEKMVKKYKFQENGEDLTILDSDGKPVQDAYQNMVNFKGLIEHEGKKLFQFRKAEDRSSAGNQSTGATSKPMSEQEWIKASAEAKTPQERAELFKQYQATQQK
jgi:hypothetical protein